MLHVGQRSGIARRRRDGVVAWVWWREFWSVAVWLVAVSMPPRAGGAAEAVPCRLRIACFNVENLALPGETTRLTRFRFEPARRRHLEGVAHVIEAIDPDIVVMPEVVSRQGVEALAALLREKGLTGFQGYHVDGADSFSGFDVALLARIEPDEVDGRRIWIHVPARAGNRSRPRAEPELPADPAEAWLRQAYTYIDDAGQTRSDEAVLQRHSLAYFTVCGRRIGLLGLHLKSNPSDAGANAQRSAEVRIARDIIRREIVGRGYLPVVLGDLNDYDPDVPMADAIRTTKTTVLRDLKDYDADVAGDELVNAAKFVGRVADRYTSHWDVNENGAADPEDVFTMIDHVLLHRDLEPAVCRVFICHAVDLGVSDHHPVVVDLVFEQPHP